jgi:uncharacterized protein (TIGR00251 family)
VNENAAYSWDGDALIVNVRTQPRASRDEWVGIHGNHFKVRITAPPVDGQANAHLIRFLAKRFKARPSEVAILSGEKGREKRIRIAAPGCLPDGISPPQ